MALIPQNSRSGPLAPKFDLLRDTRGVVPKLENPTEKSPNYLPFGVFILFSLFAIPLTLSQLRVQQDVRQRAAEILPTQIIPSPTPFPSITPEPSISPKISPNPSFYPTATPRIE